MKYKTIEPVAGFVVIEMPVNYKSFYRYEPVVKTEQT